MARISITRALVQKKNLNDRISRQMNQLKPVIVLRGTQIPTGYGSIIDYENAIKSDFQSISDLIKQRQIITESIIVSNATTKVHVGSEEITVAEAIERKKFYQTVKVPFITHMKTILAGAIRDHERLQKEQEEKIENALKTFVGRDKSGTSAEIEPIRASLEKQFSTSFIDPIKLAETIKKEENEVDSFMNDIDIILTESNSKTEIEI